MRILNFCVTPRAASGWTTGLIELNQPITVIQAPNGTGKTPLLKCLVFCLGLNVKLPDEIQKRCESVEALVSFENGKFQVRRTIGGNSFSIEVIDFCSFEKTVFDSESSYSEWFRKQLNIPSVELTTVQSQGSIIYSNILIPMFWIDQDRGWNSTYFSESKFIKDQEEELTRLFLGVRPKNPFSRIRDFEKAKSELKTTDERLHVLRRAVAHEKESLKDIAANSMLEIEREIESIKSNLGQLNGDVASSKRIASLYDENILETRKRLREIQSERDQLKSNQMRFKTVENELSAEIELLGTNVLTAQAFRSFCGNEKCALFQRSEASYGKRLLYLADQVKDIQSETSGLTERTQSLSIQEIGLLEQISSIEADKKKALEQSGYQQSLTAYRTFLERLSMLEQKKAKLGRFGNLKSEFESLLNQRESQLTAVENLAPRRSDESPSAIKNALLTSFQKWLRVLGTRELPEPNIGNGFEPRFGEENTRSFSGSTLIRILLAYRTALFEVSKKCSGSHAGILIMDAPRQHEISLDDFNSYFRQLKSDLALDGDGLQVIISLSDFIFPQEVPHQIVGPEMTIGNEKKFFGPIH